MRHILVATDGSDSGERALDFAAALARDTACTLFVVNVSSDLSTADVEALAQIESGVVEELAALSNPVLEQARQRVLSNGVFDIRTHVAWGQPAMGIIEAARTFPADVIVVGRRGRGQIASLLLGSVSQKLVGLAPCPVIVVP